MKNKTSIIYVLGSGHCGSTLLDLMMDSHSKIVGVGELENCSNQRKKKKTTCTCKRILANCPFWNKVFEGISSNIDLSVYRNKIDFLLKTKKFKNKKTFKEIDLEKYLKLNEKIYKDVLSYSKKEIIFDSSKTADRAELLVQSKDLEITLLHLVRDGRGVMWSYKRKYGRIFSPMWRWLGKNLKIELMKKRNKNIKTIFVRYEDLVKNPEKELKRILEETKLSFEPQMLNFREYEHHQIGGNRLRFKEDQEIKEDFSWKANLTKFDLCIFNLFAGWLNKRYNY